MPSFTINKGLEQIDLGGRTAHEGAVRGLRARMRLARASACRQALARKHRLYDKA